MGFYLRDCSRDYGFVAADRVQELQVMRVTIGFIFDLSPAARDTFRYSSALVVSVWQKIGDLTY